MEVLYCAWADICHMSAGAGRAGGGLLTGLKSDQLACMKWECYSR